MAKKPSAPKLVEAPVTVTTDGVSRLAVLSHLITRLTEMRDETIAAVQPAMFSYFAEEALKFPQGAAYATFKKSVIVTEGDATTMVTMAKNPSMKALTPDQLKALAENGIAPQAGAQTVAIKGDYISDSVVARKLAAWLDAIPEHGLPDDLVVAFNPKYVADQTVIAKLGSLLEAVGGHDLPKDLVATRTADPTLPDDGLLAILRLEPVDAVKLAPLVTTLKYSKIGLIGDGALEKALDGISVDKFVQVEVKAEVVQINGVTAEEPVMSMAA